MFKDIYYELLIFKYLYFKHQYYFNNIQLQNSQPQSFSLQHLDLLVNNTHIFYKFPKIVLFLANRQKDLGQTRTDDLKLEFGLNFLNYLRNLGLLVEVDNYLRISIN